MAQSEPDSARPMTTMHDLVFLFDVDNTLLDNDRVEADLAARLTEAYGVDACKLYWDIFEKQRRELGYADYLGALERVRLEKMHDPRVLRMSSWLVDGVPRPSTRMAMRCSSLGRSSAPGSGRLSTAACSSISIRSGNLPKLTVFIRQSGM
jgi:hypothetical protein